MMSDEDLRYTLSKHAQEEMIRRAIPSSLVEEVLANPQQTLVVRNDKKIFQSQILFDNDKLYLVRFVVNVQVKPVKVITVYRTKKINKYWSQP